MDTAKVRVWQEIMDLVDKIQKATIAVNNWPVHLNPNQKGYLYTQVKIMEAYEMILRIRYNQWDE